MSDLKLTDLLIRHYDELLFELRLFHTATEQYVSGRTEEDLLNNDWNDAYIYLTGPEGLTVEELYDWFVECCECTALKQYSPVEFEISSSVGDTTN